PRKPTTNLDSYVALRTPKAMGREPGRLVPRDACGGRVSRGLPPHSQETPPLGPPPRLIRARAPRSYSATHARRHHPNCCRFMNPGNWRNVLLASATALLAPRVSPLRRLTRASRMSGSSADEL